MSDSHSGLLPQQSAALKYFPHYLGLKGSVATICHAFAGPFNCICTGQFAYIIQGPELVCVLHIVINSLAPEISCVGFL